MSITEPVNSRIEVLEGRVKELERIVQTAPKTPEDADAITERIFDIIKSMLKPTRVEGVFDHDLLRGIRKALNEFYRGPYRSNTELAEQNKSLQAENEMLKAEVQKQMETIDRISAALGGNIV